MAPKFNLPYQFEITLIRQDQPDDDKRRHLYLRKGHSETFLHILIKILAYCYFWDESEEIEIEPNFKFRGYKPDLLKLIPSEIPRRLQQDVGLWVECKDVAIRKLRKLAKILPRSRIFWFHLDNYFNKLLKDGKIHKEFNSSENIHFIGIEIEGNAPDFLASKLREENLKWIFKMEEESIELTDGNWQRRIKFRQFL